MLKLEYVWFDEDYSTISLSNCYNSGHSWTGEHIFIICRLAVNVNCRNWLYKSVFDGVFDEVGGYFVPLLPVSNYILSFKWNKLKKVKTFFCSIIVSESAVQLNFYRPQQIIIYYTTCIEKNIIISNTFE